MATRTRLLRGPRRRAGRLRRGDQARVPAARPAVAPRRQPGGRRRPSGSRRSTRPTRSSPTRSGARRTTCSGRPATAATPGLRGRRRSAGSATSSTRSSAAPQAGARRGHRRPARTCATTCGSRSRRRSRAPRRRSSSPVLGRCETCSGSGAAPGSDAVDLPAVRGPRRGPLVAPDDARPDGQRLDVPALPGRGQADRRARAPPASGDGRTERKRTLRVTIPPGIDEGHQIRLSNEGEVGPRGGPAGSLYVAVHVAPHPTLRREGTELFYDADVSIAQAALGHDVTVPTVDGEEEVEIKAGTQPGTEIRLRGRGVPHLRRSGFARRSPRVGRTSSSPRSSRRAARAARGVARGGRRAGVGERRRDPREGPRRARLSAGGRSTRPGGLPAGAWLELAVAADVEAVEAVARSLAGSRRAARPWSRRSSSSRRAGRPHRRRRDRRSSGPTCPRGDPAAVAAGGRRGVGGARPSPGVRAPPDRRADDPRRPRGRLGRSVEGALPGPARRPTARHPADLARASRRAPATSCSRSTRAWRSGPGCTRRRGCASRPSRRRRGPRDGSPDAARPRRRLRLGHPRDRGAAAGAARRSASTPTRSRSRRRARTPRRNGSQDGMRAREGSLPTGEPPFDLVLANLIAACSSRSRRCSARSCGRRGAHRLRDLHRPRGGGRAGVRSGGPRDAGARRRGRLGRARGGATGLGRSACPTRVQSAGDARLFPLLLVTHIMLAVSLFLPSILLPFALRARRAADESPNRVRPVPAAGCRPTARWSSGSGSP